VCIPFIDPKGGEGLGDKEGSEEEKEVIPAQMQTPEVRPLTSGVFLWRPVLANRSALLL
jgi:hypothetical protein